MIAINGYVENGRFTSQEFIKLPQRTAAILIVQDMELTLKNENELAWLDEFHRILDESEHEELKIEDFPRADFGRDLIILGEE